MRFTDHCDQAGNNRQNVHALNTNQRQTFGSDLIVQLQGFFIDIIFNDLFHSLAGRVVFHKVDDLLDIVRAEIHKERSQVQIDIAQELVNQNLVYKFCAQEGNDFFDQLAALKPRQNILHKDVIGNILVAVGFIDEYRKHQIAIRTRCSGAAKAIFRYKFRAWILRNGRFH